MIGSFYRAGSWVTIVEVGKRTEVGSYTLSDLQSFETVRVFLTVTRGEETSDSAR